MAAGVVYVSHRLDDIVAVADRVSILRDGELVGVHRASEVSTSRLANLMVGRQVVSSRAAHYETAVDDEPVLTVRGLAGRRLDGFDLDVRPGEVVGIAGVLGSGREELPYALAGAAGKKVMGTVSVDGRSVEAGQPGSAHDAGIGFVPADRLREAVVSDFCMRENLSLARLQDTASYGFVRRSREDALVEDWVERFEVVPNDPERPFPKFSGGNQQKVVVARALTLSPKVLVLSEPTAGVDIGAREALYQVIRDEIAARRLAVVVASSDIGDLVALANRVVVLREGRQWTELQENQINYRAIVHATEGTTDDDTSGEEIPS